MAYFDLANGAIGTKSSEIDAKIESYGDYGFYRISLTFNHNNPQVRIYPADADNDTSGTTGSIYIQDAQLEAGLVATDYIETGATTAQAGILEDLPRIDYSGGASCPALLLEPQRTNVWIHSEYLDYSFSSIIGVTITQNTTETLSPEGLYNATKLEGLSSWVFRDAIFGTNTGTYTISCYVKAVNASSNNTFRLCLGGNNFSNNLTATSEWQKFEYTITNGGGTVAGLLRDSLSNSSDLYIYGFQVEEGSYATSYIPTYGSSVTRSGDSCSKTGIGSLIGQTEGTMFVEVENNPSAYLFNAPDNVIFASINAGSYLENFHFLTDSSNIYIYCNASSGVLQAAIGTTMPTTSTLKMAVTYTSSAIKFFLNGALVGTDTSFTLPSGMNRIDVGFMANQPDSQRMRGGTKQFLLSKSALSDTQAIELTTL